MMMTTMSKTQNYECCMCGDHGLSHELFRCKVCHFRSQHRYCSNLYPKAESYRVCNWCLIQKDDNNHSHNHTSTNTPATVTSNNNNNHLGGPKAGPGPKGVQPISPIKKPVMRSTDDRSSPSVRKRIRAVNYHVRDDRLLRRTKSSHEIMSINKINNNNNISNNNISINNNNNNNSNNNNNNNNSNNSNNNNNNNNSNSSSGSRSSGGGPIVIKHVFRNKVRRYKLLDEVSS